MSVQGGHWFPLVYCHIIFLLMQRHSCWVMCTGYFPLFKCNKTRNGLYCCLVHRFCCIGIIFPFRGLKKVLKVITFVLKKCADTPHTAFIGILESRLPTLCPYSLCLYFSCFKKTMPLVHKAQSNNRQIFQFSLRNLTGLH